MKREKLRTFDIILVILLITNLIVSFVSLGLAANMRGTVLAYESLMNNNLGDAADKAESDPDPADEKIITGSKMEKQVKALQKDIDNLIHSNVYIVCPEDENYDKYSVSLYNKNGEVLVQSSNGDVTAVMNDSNSIYYSKEDETMLYCVNCDVLRSAYYALQAAKDGKADFTKVEVAKEYKDTHTGYAVNIYGYDGIEKMYSALGDDFGKDMKNVYKQSVDGGEWTDDINTDKVNMRFEYVYDNGTLISCSAYLFFNADASNKVVDYSKCYLLWTFDSYTDVGNWELGEDWYKFDYENMNTDENSKKISDMMVELTKNVKEMVNKYIDSDDGTSDNTKNNSGVSVQIGNDGIESIDEQ